MIKFYMEIILHRLLYQFIIAQSLNFILFSFIFLLFQWRVIAKDDHQENNR